MNWIIFGVLTWVALALELGLRDALELGQTGIGPHPAMVLAIFVAMWAPPRTAYAAALILGAGLDLVHWQATSAGTSVVVLGPNALGALLGAYAVVTARPLLMRRNVMALVVLTAVATALAQLLATTLLTVRAVHDIVIIGSAIDELGRRLGSALYTGVLALPLGFVLMLIQPALRFTPETRTAYRGH
jgi:hypothetical protein